MIKSKSTDFLWGVSSSAFQSEGAWNIDEKGESIWDRFTQLKGKIKKNENAQVTSDFYHRYPSDISIIKELEIPNFRFSVSWPRIFPSGTGHLNMKGIDFYNRIIDTCLENNITPWVTCYHWDLPQILEDKGGWTSRDTVKYFSDYVAAISLKFGDRVKNWMVLNEPMAFTGAGYFLGIHAPGKRNFSGFIKSVHHATLAQAEGGRVLRDLVEKSFIGTCFSTSFIEPVTLSPRNVRAAARLDALFNRLFIEPSLGMGYPVADLNLIKGIYRCMLPGDEQLMKFDFDFIGIQNYTRFMASHSIFTPWIHAKIIKPDPKKVAITTMNWEIYPEGIYRTLKQFGKYPNIKSIIITENGAAFHDPVVDNRIDDSDRINFLNDYIDNVMRAKKEGVPVDGYFVWSLTDNFEWAEGYEPRFGLVHVDFETQKRIIKNSGYWYRDIIRNQI